MNPIYTSRRRNDIIIRALCVGAALFGVTWLALILFTLFYNGLAGINLAVFTQDTPPPGSTEGGLRNAIIGSIMMTVIGVGIGASWNEQESRGLGIPFPPLKERFEQLEETLKICLQMLAGDQTPFVGKHFRLERPLNSPQSLQRPHPPILIGGMGEKKTLRLVAKYADACNLFPTPEVPNKLRVLRRHCEDVGRDYDSILKTAMFTFDVGERGEKVDALLGQLRWLAGMGMEAAIGQVKNVHALDPLRIMGDRVIPAAAQIEAKTAV